MLYAIGSGYTLRFTGFEMVGIYDNVGPSFKSLRQSVGAEVIFQNCVHRRYVGLPYEAAIVNMVAASRPPGRGDTQLCYQVSNFTYKTTRSPEPVFLETAVRMQDYSTVTTPDSSLAFQGLYYGGYTFTSLEVMYAVDRFINPDCLKTRPGTECVTLYTKIYQDEENPKPSPPASPSNGGGGTSPAPSSTGGDSGGSSNSATIAIAVAVPVGTVALLSIALAVFLARRRSTARAARAKAAQDADLEASGEGAAAGGKARRNSSVAGGASGDTGCVFLGLDEGQALPEWSPLADDELVDLDEEENRTYGTNSAAPRPVVGEVTVSGRALPLERGRVASGDGNGRLVSSVEGTAAGGGASSDRGLSGKLGTGQAQSGPPTGNGGSDTRITTAEALAAAAETGPRLPAGPHPRVPREQQPATLVGSSITTTGGGKGTGSGLLRPLLSSSRLEAATVHPHAGSSSSGDPVVVATPEPPKGPDVVAEMGALALELRTTVKDVAIKLESVLGSGSFGVVYKGTWQGLPVAVKTVVFSASQERRRRALQEAALCQSISHPNIIATYACELQPIGGAGTAPTSMGSENGNNPNPAGANNGGPAISAKTQGDAAGILDWRLYIVMEFADAGPLRRLYGTKDIWGGPDNVNMPAILSLALGIARALSHLHSKRIVHGDLNPNNVMLKRDPAEPSGYAVKIGDFGLSVMLPDHRTHLSNLRMGTMFYICPAVVMKGHVGPASDVFSMGVMLWELYHGRRAGIRTPEGPRYCSFFPAFPPSCPPAYRNVALHCLQRQPQNRPPATVVEGQLEWLRACLLSTATDPNRPLPPQPLGLPPGPGL
ncbi:hypothetical protein HYH03_012569 [Edaphochlamys debaryana]|uniref:Protein kinase domain-containing protein n=1 Tax=Edaphochlamys debaryana TaxID=47281 RepID=A0A836BU17_9CHLO|nr:hypothetical protein HYH03_012569 [Edaphochlamys debaryana]|eukprot:KAG2488950.1 hypothetical protein HYH03_012569 [Edaphochlamys debaryana]